MKRRLIFVFLLIIIIPVAALLYLGIKTAKYERESARVHLKEIFEARLSDISKDIGNVLKKHEEKLIREINEKQWDENIIKEYLRTTPLAGNIYMTNEYGHVTYPDISKDLTDTDYNFLNSVKDVVENPDLLTTMKEGMPQNQKSGETPVSPHNRIFMQQPSQSKIQEMQQQQSSPNQQTTVFSNTLSTNEAPLSIRKPQEAKPAGGYPENGWYTWYWGKEFNLLFWNRFETGNIIGIKLNKTYLISEIIAALPDTTNDKNYSANESFRLMDSNKSVIYQWGKYVPGKDEKPFTEISASPPLAAWSLQYYLPKSQLHTFYGKTFLFNLISGLILIAISIIILAVYFYKESTRELKEAAQRVTFVNQVSHELKTPLTNIRMYAELLEDYVPEDDEKTHDYLTVITTESRRLSRLIGNILTFSRKQRNKLCINPKTGFIDNCIKNVIENFKISFEEKGISVEYKSLIDSEIKFDADIVEQILGNLFSNTEKYADGCTKVKIGCSMKDDIVAIVFSDNGPGIPSGENERIFQPFYRISNKLTDGVSGTGIGLTISRDLARLHGGDLIVQDCFPDKDEGAEFILTFKVEK